MAADSQAVDMAGGHQARVRFRATRRQALFLCCPFLLILAEQSVLYAVARLPIPAFDGWIDLAAGLLVTSSLVPQLRWFGATLTPAGIQVHNLRRRQIPWHDLTAVRVERFMLSQTVVLYERVGRRTRLRMPITGPLFRDPDFGGKVQQIHSYWLRQSAGMITAPQAPERTGFAGPPDLLRTRPAWTQRVVVCFAFGWLGLGQSLSWLAVGTASQPPSSGQEAFALVAGLVAVAAIWQWAVRSGITMTPAALVVHGLRRRELGWPDIQSITLRRRLGGTRLLIMENSGRCTRLPAPRAGFLLWDSDFGAKTLALHRWWVQHRGPGWQPAVQGSAAAVAEQLSRWSGSRTLDDIEPADAAEIAAYGSPSPWQCVVLGLFVAAASVEVLILLIVLVLSIAS
jgi:hypothetical protein